MWHTVNLLPCLKSVVLLGHFFCYLCYPALPKGNVPLETAEIIDLHKQRLSSFFFSLVGLTQKYKGLQSEPQLSDLMNEVASKVSGKWKAISIQLGLTLNDQKCFIDATSGDPNQCFTFVFNVWRNRATRPYTWSTLIQTLESPAVDEVRLAQELRTKLQS